MPAKTKGEVSQNRDNLRIIKSQLRWENNPLDFAEKTFTWGEGKLKNEKLLDWQKEFLLKIVKNRNLAEDPKTIVCSAGNGVGKSALIAILIIWFVVTKREGKLAVLANTEDQLRLKTWAELGKWVKLNILQSFLTLTSTSLIRKMDGNECIAYQQVWSEGKEESVAGAHSANNMVIYDEASGIPESIMNATEGILATGDSYLLMFGNPTKLSGGFYKRYHDPSGSWEKMRVSCLDVERINRKFIEKKKLQFGGVESNQFRVYVEGKFPLSGSGIMFSENLLEKLFRGNPYSGFQRPESKTIMGVDVASFKAGGDFSAICIRYDTEILLLERFKGYMYDFETRIRYLQKNYRCDHIFIDSCGVGSGTYESLSRHSNKVEEFYGASRAINPGRFFNKKSELIWAVKGFLEARTPYLGDLEEATVLESEMRAMSYFINEKGLIRLNSKQDQRKELIYSNSSDIFDAFAYSFASIDLGLEEDTSYNYSRYRCVY